MRQQPGRVRRATWPRSAAAAWTPSGTATSSRPPPAGSRPPSTPFDVTAGGITTLEIAAAPTSATGGSRVRRRRREGVRRGGNPAGGTVALALVPELGTEGAVLTCPSPTATATGGVATFAGCTDRPGRQGLPAAGDRRRNAHRDRHDRGLRRLGRCGAPPRLPHRARGRHRWHGAGRSSPSWRSRTPAATSSSAARPTSTSRWRRPHVRGADLRRRPAPGDERFGVVRGLRRRQDRHVHPHRVVGRPRRRHQPALHRGGWSRVAAALHPAAAAGRARQAAQHAAEGPGRRCRWQPGAAATRGRRAGAHPRHRDRRCLGLVLLGRADEQPRHASPAAPSASSEAATPSPPATAPCARRACRSTSCRPRPQRSARRRGVSPSRRPSAAASTATTPPTCRTRSTRPPARCRPA